MIQSFDFDTVAKKLQPLSGGRQIAFATSCAQRLASIFRLGEQAWGWHGRAERFQAILDDCWALALSPSDGSVLNRVRGADWENLFQGGDHTDTRGLRLFAFRPLSEIEIVVDCAIEPTDVGAARAAQKEYDIMTGYGDVGLPGSQLRPGMSPDQVRAAVAARNENLHGHAIVQNCLESQAEALDRIAAEPGMSKDFLDEYRRRALLVADEYARAASQIFAAN